MLASDQTGNFWIERMFAKHYCELLLPISRSRRYLHANRDCGRTSPVYPVPAIACTAISLGSRRKFTASMDSANTSLTFAKPRSFT